MSLNETVTTIASTTLGTLTNTTLNLTTTAKPLKSQLFLQSTACQAISGLFAWCALLITAHHVCYRHLFGFMII